MTRSFSQIKNVDISSRDIDDNKKNANKLAETRKKF